MPRINMSILGPSELRWTGIGHLTSDEYQIFHCGPKNHRRNNAAIFVNKRVSHIVLSFNRKNNRMIVIRLQGKSINVTMNPVCAPTINVDKAKIDEFYASLQ